MKKRTAILTALLLAAGSAMPVRAADTELLRADFESGLSGWESRGGASVAVSADAAADGSASAAVTDRSAAWNGISYAVGSKCPAGTCISVQAQVMQRSGESVHFKMTMQYQSGGQAVYDTFAEGDAASGEWTKLSAESYTVPQGTDPVLYFETDTAICDFYLDDVVITRIGAAVLPSGNFRKGDADHSGKVEKADAEALRDYLLGKDIAVGKDAADLDGDGVLTAKDLSGLKDLLLNPPAEPGHDTDYMSKVRDQINTNVPQSIQRNAGGKLEHITYFSQTANRNKGANVWMPPGYDTSEQYPVLYVNHGYGGDENTMANSSAIREMATNLIQSGDAVPMIIVFTDQYSDPAHQKQTGNGQADVPGYDLFVEDLPGSLMPYIESHYPVKTGREYTAISGFSMGGRESLYIGMKCCDKIGYIGAAAPAPGIFRTKDQFMDHPGVMTKDEIRIDPPYSPYLLLIAGGTSDNMVNDFPEQYHKLFTEHGTENIFMPVPGGGHDDSTVIPLMYNFIRLIFKA